MEVAGLSEFASRSDSDTCAADSLLALDESSDIVRGETHLARRNQ